MRHTVTVIGSKPGNHVSSRPKGVSPILYAALRRLLQVAVELYYVDVQVANRGSLPAEGPVIFAANHPNSIMDSVILGTQVDRQIYYLAKSELFKNPLVALIFDRCGVIPLHKNPTGDKTNDEAFRSAFELLGEGGCLGIFPEGRNSLERGVLKIKTGVARIALGAEREHGYDLGVRIVPVGLNFENRDRFMSRVLVRIGEPIDARRYAEKHRGAERDAVVELTAEVDEALREAVTVMEDERVRRLTHRVERMYGRELLEDMIAYREERRESGESYRFDDRELLNRATGGREEQGGFRQRLLDEFKQKGRSSDDDSLDRKLWVQERIAKAIDYYSQEAPELVEQLRVRVIRYLDHLDQFQIRGDIADRLPDTLSRRREAAKLTAYAIAFAGPAMWGFVANAIPYNLTRIAALQAPDEPMRAFTGLLSGTLIFSLFYGGMTWGVWSASAGSLILTSLFLLSLPVTGFFFLRYRRQISKYRNRILTRTLFVSRQRLVDALLAERDELVRAFDELRDHFRVAEEAIEADEEAPPVPDIDLSAFPWSAGS